MTYYQILKARRIDLNLSIQDVSSQTRLAPQYIQAIEENNLEVFSDDYSFVRYFVHAYCDAIGVNWAAVQQQVDAHIQAYARAKNMALTQAQRRMAMEMNSFSSKSTKKRRIRSPWKRAISNMTRYMFASKKQMRKMLILLGIAVVVVLSSANMVISFISDQQAQAADESRKEQLAQKEAETERLASARQAEKEKQKPVLKIDDASANEYTISNVLEYEKKVHIVVSVPQETPTTVAIYLDGALIAGSETEVLTSDFEKDVPIEKAGQMVVAIGTYSENTVTVCDQKLTFSQYNWIPGTEAEFFFTIAQNEQESEQ